MSAHVICSPILRGLNSMQTTTFQGAIIPQIPGQTEDKLSRNPLTLANPRRNANFVRSSHLFALGQIDSEPVLKDSLSSRPSENVWLDSINSWSPGYFRVGNHPLKKSSGRNRQSGACLIFKFPSTSLSLEL